MAGHPSNVRTVVCPDCGEVKVTADIRSHGDMVSGLCPECGDRLYFEPGEPEGDKREG